MPAGTKVSDEEKEVIAKVGYALRAKKPTIGPSEIGKILGRSPQTITKVMSDRKFEKYRNNFKKKIDAIRFEAISAGDKQVLESIGRKELKPYQLIGMSKVFYEQSFGLQNGPQVNVNGNQQAIQVVEGNVSYNPKSNSEEPK